MKLIKEFKSKIKTNIFFFLELSPYYKENIRN